MQLFFAGEGHDLYGIKQAEANDGWGEVAPIGHGIEARQIAVGMNENGTLEIFYVGMENHIWHDRETAPGSGDWAQWNSWEV